MTNISIKSHLAHAFLVLSLFLYGDQIAWATPQENSKGNAEYSSQFNVLVILVDDLGFGDLSCQGATDLQTPEIDRLFSQSLRLDRFYANCPVCSPTRAALLSGFYPDRVGVPGVIRTTKTNSWGYFSPPKPTLPSIMQKLGYRTAAIGKWHLGLDQDSHPLRYGFDTFNGFLGDMMDDYYTHRRRGFNYMRDGYKEIDPQGHATDLFTQWAVDYISAGASLSQPWFLYLPYNAPHTPIQPPTQWLERVKQRESEIDDQRAALVALIEHMDSGIGKVIDAITISKQQDKTIVIFTSDNGGQLNVGANNGPLRDGKQSMYEGGLRVPACIKIPGRTKAGSRSPAIASTVDLMPTIIESVGGDLPKNGDGQSLLPLVENPDQSWLGREVYFVRREGGLRYNGLTIEGLLQGNMKLVHNLPTMQFELFDLQRDPKETTNLAAKQPKVFREMMMRLQYHIQQSGHVPWQKP